jgi:hypothetical protein
MPYSTSTLLIRNLQEGGISVFRGISGRGYSLGYTDLTNHTRMDSREARLFR